MNRFPFEETVSSSGRIRIFSEKGHEDELVWHRDDEDRIVKVLEGDGWLFQFDNELPQAIGPGTVIRIARGVWHRVIRRGESRLVVEINKS